jgi:hypothetical protein
VGPGPGAQEVSSCQSRAWAEPLPSKGLLGRGAVMLMLSSADTC